MPGRRPEDLRRPEPVQSYADWKPDWLDAPELARPLTVESELVPELVDFAAEWLKKHEPASWGLEGQASWEPFQKRLIDLLFYEPRLTGPRWARLVARVLGVCAEMRMTPGPRRDHAWRPVLTGPNWAVRWAVRRGVWAK